MCKLSPWQGSSRELEKERRGLLGQPKAAARGGPWPKVRCRSTQRELLPTDELKPHPSTQPQLQAGAQTCRPCPASLQKSQCCRALRAATALPKHRARNNDINPV